MPQSQNKREGFKATLKESEEFEAFLDRLNPDRHKESAAIYSSLMTEVRWLMGLHKGESITDFLRAFRWIFLTLSWCYCRAIPIRYWNSKRRHNSLIATKALSASSVSII